MQLSAPRVKLSNPKEQLAWFSLPSIILYLSDKRKFQCINTSTTAFRFYVDGKGQFTGILL